MNTTKLAVSHTGVLTFCTGRDLAPTAQHVVRKATWSTIMTAVQTIVAPQVIK
jgi:hypothetical protein